VSQEKHERKKHMQMDWLDGIFIALFFVLSIAISGFIFNTQLSKRSLFMAYF